MLQSQPSSNSMIVDFTCTATKRRGRAWLDVQLGSFQSVFPRCHSDSARVEAAAPVGAPEGRCGRNDPLPRVGTLLRITLQCLRAAAPAALPKTKLWIDAEIDGLHFPSVFANTKKGYESYRAYIEKFENARKLVGSPTTGEIAPFVKSVLDSILEAADGLSNLGYISVPQLPYTPGSGRNRVNRMLAEHSLKWKSAQRRPLRFLLPVIFAQKWGQADTKTLRNEKVKLAVDCFESSGADGVWIVDSTLDDHAAVGTLENQRLPGVIHFHEELNAKLPMETVTIAGPYWGLNLALWARVGPIPSGWRWKVVPIFCAGKGTAVFNG
jgi:hypothetical protein